MFNRTTAIVLVVALAAALGFWAAQRWFAQPAPGPQLQAVKLFEQPRELPGYSLQQSDGTQLVPGELKGHWTVVFLGFTHCPDVCPTTLAQLAQAQKQSGHGCCSSRSIPSATPPTGSANTRMPSTRTRWRRPPTSPRWKPSRVRCRWCS